MAPPAEAPDKLNSAIQSRWRSFYAHGFIVLIYSLTHCLALLNRGLFWDDWVFWQQDKTLVSQVGRDMGSTWPSTINNFLFYGDAGLTFGRLLSFFALLAAALLLFGILRRLPGVTQNTALWIAILFSVYPGYTARQAIVMVGYALCLAFFMGAVWLLVRHAPKPSILVRLAAAVLFLTSFHTRSLLVMSGVLPVVLLMVDPPDSWKLRPVVLRLMRYADQMALPFIYFAVTRIWFQPRGLYADYNVLLPEKTNVARVLWSGIVRSVPASLVWTDVNPELLAFVVVCVLFVPVVLWGWRRWPLRHNAGDLWLFDAGAALVFLGVAPYAAVGKMPAFTAFETRHQLLLPIGWGFITTAIAQAHARHSRVGRILVALVLALVISFFAAFHIQSYIGYQREWLKEQALMEAFGESREIRRSQTILFEDKTMSWNAGHRQEGRQHYEYNGMFAQTFGDQTRFGIERGHFRSIPHAFEDGFATLERNQYYKLKDWQRHDPDYVVTIREGELDLSPASTVLKLTILDWVNREDLRTKLSKAIVLKIKPYAWEPGDPLVDYTLPPHAVP